MARFITVLVLIWLGFTTTTAQPAPNFIVTTSDGSNVDLYADWLDQGKAVVLEVMFISCPPCGLYSPYLEPLYQEWGGGNGPVELISISDKSFDSNADMAAWKQPYGMTFAAVGSDGGGLDAVSPYKGGNWGPFTGTPTFVVIAPDRTVQFDIQAATPLATMDSLSAALERALDTMLVPDPAFHFEGHVRAQPVDTTRIEGIEFTLVQSNGTSTILSETTDADGYYSLDFDPGTLSEGDFIKLSFPNEIKAIEGVTSFDMALVQRHLLGLGNLGSLLEELKSDVNGDGILNILDIIEFRKLVLGVQENWPRDQVFFPASSEPVMQAGGGSTPYTSQIPIIDGVFEYLVDFYIVKYGDVNRSFHFPD